MNRLPVKEVLRDRVVDVSRFISQVSSHLFIMNEEEKQAAKRILDNLLKESGAELASANAYRLLMEGVERRVNAEKATSH